MAAKNPFIAIRIARESRTFSKFKLCSMFYWYSFYYVFFIIFSIKNGILGNSFLYYNNFQFLLFIFRLLIGWLFILLKFT